MGANGKSIRDALLTGGPVAVVVIALQRAGFSVEESVFAAPFVAGFAMRLYRALRSRWPWLEALDG